MNKQTQINMTRHSSNGHFPRQPS